MNWRAWVCWLRGKHVARPPYVKVYPLPPAVPMYCVLDRTCWCGEQSKPSLHYDFRPGGIINYETEWPAR